MFSGLESRVVEIVDSFGYFGISTLIIAETVFPPIPSEIILPLAGFTASQGDLTLPGVLLAATIGSIIGALILYGFGLWIGRERLMALTNRYGRYFLIKEEDIIRAETRAIERHLEETVRRSGLRPEQIDTVDVASYLAGQPAA